MKKMSSNRNRLVAPRNVVNTKMLYTFYILKELAKGETIFGNKILEVFRNKFQNAERPFPVSSSTIYETMNKRSKKVYAITDDGVEFYKNHIADYVDNLKKTKSTLDLMIEMLI